MRFSTGSHDSPPADQKPFIRVLARSLAAVAYLALITFCAVRGFQVGVGSTWGASRCGDLSGCSRDLAMTLALGIAPAISQVPVVRRLIPYAAVYLGAAVTVAAWFVQAALFVAFGFLLADVALSADGNPVRLLEIPLAMTSSTALAVSSLIALRTRGRPWVIGLWIVGVAVVAVSFQASALAFSRASG